MDEKDMPRLVEIGRPGSVGSIRYTVVGDRIDWTKGYFIRNTKVVSPLRRALLRLRAALSL